LAKKGEPEQAGVRLEEIPFWQRALSPLWLLPVGWAVGWLAERGGAPEPWVLVVNVTAPHFPHLASRELWDLYPDGGDLPRYGIEEQSAAKRFIRIRKPVEVRDGDKWARLTPYNGFKVNFEIDFDHPVLQRHRQTASLDFSTTAFLK